jgi:hypothetical protein
MANTAMEKARVIGSLLVLAVVACGGGSGKTRDDKPLPEECDAYAKASADCTRRLTGQDDPLAAATRRSFGARASLGDAERDAMRDTCRSALERLKTRCGDRP